MRGRNTIKVNILQCDEVMTEEDLLQAMQEKKEKKYDTGIAYENEGTLLVITEVVGYANMCKLIMGCKAQSPKHVGGKDRSSKDIGSMYICRVPRAHPDTKKLLKIA
jgi:hypothetical protein